jgi:hypothetical protein
MKITPASEDEIYDLRLTIDAPLENADALVNRKSSIVN